MPESTIQAKTMKGMARTVNNVPVTRVMVALAYAGDRYVNSEWLAGSIGTNPAVIRRTLRTLKKSGLVESKGGVYGGTRLARSTDKITLRDLTDSGE